MDASNYATAAGLTSQWKNTEIQIHNWNITINKKITFIYKCLLRYCCVLLILMYKIIKGKNEISKRLKSQSSAR